MEDVKPAVSQEEHFGKLKVLDIGCGAGILSESIGRLGAGQVLGIDPTDKCVQLAEEHLSIYPELKKHVTYKNTTLENLLSEKDLTKVEELFDLVCCSEVIEHVDN
jgi:polyprenyldihydroxybenzoate methyltransferase/3-demethylubiquinol 3-O-methyltransferase